MAANESLSLADRDAPLPAEDLELLATSAYMLGRDEEYVDALERAHQAYLDDGEPLRSARCAFWIATNLTLRGERAQATGWFGRARRLVEREGRECVEEGYLLMQTYFEHMAAGDYEAALATAGEVAAIAERFGDPDVFALSSQDRAILLIKLGRVGEGLRLLDECMVALTAGELSPIVNGLVYCGVINGCQAAYDARRAQEWTTALTKWCEAQPDMVSFTGTCRVHRAELMQLRGEWAEALQEAQQACERCTRAGNRRAAAEALYRQGEVHRLRGEFDAAEQAYRAAREGGREPQPGLALLRLAQGKDDAADAAIRRVLSETSEPSARVGLLPAFVDIMLAVGDTHAARSACEELEQRAGPWAGGMVDAMVARVHGAVALAEGDAAEALVALRRAERAWRELDAPYEAARVRVLMGLACRALGDEETAELELDAARNMFERLGAAPDVGDLDEQADGESLGLTPRELEVLRLVAAGKSNREIADELTISEHTVARHLQNIFAKLRVSSRTAASAFAFTHDLV